MTGRRWISLTFGTLVTVLAIVTSVCYAVDPCGVLRDPTGRKLAIYFADRKAKFLMNKRYVPTNFQGLFTGASSTGNWDIPSLGHTTIYNESLAGANASEEEYVVDQALTTGRFELAIITLSPAMAHAHQMEDGLDTVTSLEAVGSIHALVNSAAHVLAALRIKFPRSDAAPDGQTPYFERSGRDSHTHVDRLASDVKVLDPSYFALDSAELQHLRAMTIALRGRGARIVYVVPPVYGPLYELNKSGFAASLGTMRQQLPNAPLIDLNGPEFASLTNDRDLFFDGYHLQPDGTVKFYSILRRLVPAALASRS
jgi:hypothetical protein